MWTAHTWRLESVAEWVVVGWWTRKPFYPHRCMAPVVYMVYDDGESYLCGLPGPAMQYNTNVLLDNLQPAIKQVE